MKQTLTAIGSLLFSSSPHRLSNQRKPFSKYPLAFLLGGIMLLVSSCQKEDNLCKKTVPFKAVFQVQSAVTQQGPPLLISATGTGYGTPIGKSSFVGHAQVDASNNFTDNGIITASNGDQIFETAKGPGPVVDPTNGNFLIISQNIITGGTGKYAGATGSYTTIAHGNVNSPDGIDSLKGTITTDECNGNKWLH